MIYLLDTNTCIFYLNNSNANIVGQLEKLPTSRIRIPSIVAAELMYGAEKSGRREHNMKIFRSFLSIYDITDFGGRAIDSYGEIRADLERRGQTIGGNDIIIAATVLANDGILITNNTDEFSRVKGLKTEDWKI